VKKRLVDWLEEKEKRLGQVQKKRLSKALKKQMGQTNDKWDAARQQLESLNNKVSGLIQKTKEAIDQLNRLRPESNIVKTSVTTYGVECTYFSVLC